jgi:hypothetical protein
MRKMGLINLKGRMLEIPNWDGLIALGEFNPQHLNGLIDTGVPAGNQQEARS